MMLSNKKSTSKSWIKVFALLPIVGLALALNAETVNDYVYKEEQQQPQAKVVKKGKKNAQIKMGTKTIEVKEEKTVGTKADKQQSNDWEENLIFLGEQFGDAEPLIVIDGKVSTSEQLKALDKKEVDNITVMKNEGALKVYAKQFNADTSNGILFINTKEYVKNGEKKVVEVVVKAKKPEEAEKPLDVVEEMPKFPGGDAAMMEFLRNTVKYPEEAEENGIQGRVVVQFIIEKDGSISGAEVIKKVNEHLDAEALRVIGEMPKWTPGKQKGEAVRVKFTLPVTFRLS